MKVYKILILTAALAIVSCGKQDGAPTANNGQADSMRAAGKAIYAAMEAGNADEAGKYMSEDMKENTPSPGQKPGLAGFKEWVVANKAAFPDLKFVIEDMRVDGDMAFARVRMQGTNTGSMMGMPATGKKVDVMFIDMVRWSNGKFVEHWGYGEEMKMMTQLGLMPPMGEAPPAETGAPAAEKK